MPRKPFNPRTLTAQERMELDALITEQRVDDRDRISHFRRCVSLDLVIAGDGDGVTRLDTLALPDDYTAFGELRRLMEQADLVQHRWGRRKREHGWRFTRKPIAPVIERKVA